MAVISQRAFDHIVAKEVTSKAYYEKHYTRPEWPGVKSGVTVAIGYDLGYASPSKIRSDWGNLVSSSMLDAMLKCSGVRGNAARALLNEVRPLISIPWNSAMAVFAKRDIPTWTALVIRKLPKAAHLSPTCLGVLVGISYNRGASFDAQGDRYVEMRSIKAHIEAGQLDKVFHDINAMKRLWPNVPGLQRRREEEARLWNEGLTIPGVPAAGVPGAPQIPDPGVPTEAGPARTKPKPTSPTQNGTTGTIVVGGSGGAVVAQQKGLLTTEQMIFVVLAAILLGVSIWLVWWRNRNPK
jgi:hypothetical protein